MKFSYLLLKKLLKDLPPKKKVIDLLNLYSFEAEDLGEDIIDISLPSNRYSDAASHFGISRELGVILNQKFNLPVKLLVNQPENNQFVKIKIENKNDCFRYLAYYFEIPEVKESSPEIKKILKSCGINPINNIVDIANLVMLETGQPLHIFDADKLLPENKFPKTIFVRRAKKGEIIETLDNQKIELNPEILVISDFKNSLAIAGIKGGLHSGVTKSTRRIILEAANFDSVLIYKASKFINLKTDASIRFAHGLSEELVKIGADRAFWYLKKLGAKLIDSYDTNPKKLTEKVIDFDALKYEKLIGAKIILSQAQKYFNNLGFEVQKINQNVLRVKVPNWRMDILNFEDLADEALRFMGINELKPTRPVFELISHFEDNIFILKDKIRNILQKLKFSEVYNHSLISEDDKIIKELNLNFENKLIEVLHPVSRDFKYLRPSLLIWLKQNLLENSKFFDEVLIFEIGKVFYEEKNNLIEKLSCGLGILSNKNISIFEMKGVIDSLFKNLGISDFLMIEDNHKIKIEINFKPIGYIYHFKTKKNQYVALAEFDASSILNILEEENEFKPIPKYPSIMRDISILVSKDVKIGEIMELISGQSNLIRDIDLIDEYWEEGFGDRQSLTFRLIFQDENKTLTEKEVDDVINKINLALKNIFKAEIR